MINKFHSLNELSESNLLKKPIPRTRNIWKNPYYGKLLGFIYYKKVINFQRSEICSENLIKPSTWSNSLKKKLKTYEPKPLISEFKKRNVNKTGRDVKIEVDLNNFEIEIKKEFSKFLELKKITFENNLFTYAFKDIFKHEKIRNKKSKKQAIIGGKRFRKLTGKKEIPIWIDYFTHINDSEIYKEFNKLTKKDKLKLDYYNNQKQLSELDQKKYNLLINKLFRLEKEGIIQKYRTQTLTTLMPKSIQNIFENLKKLKTPNKIDIFSQIFEHQFKLAYNYCSKFNLFSIHDIFDKILILFKNIFDKDRNFIKEFTKKDEMLIGQNEFKELCKFANIYFSIDSYWPPNYKRNQEDKDG